MTDMSEAAQVRHGLVDCLPEGAELAHPEVDCIVIEATDSRQISL